MRSRTFIFKKNIDTASKEKKLFEKEYILLCIFTKRNLNLPILIYAYCTYEFPYFASYYKSLRVILTNMSASHCNCVLLDKL